jgi:hypothetical protein
LLAKDPPTSTRKKALGTVRLLVLDRQAARIHHALG